MTAGGATSLCCSLFLAVSFNNNQSIVCGGLEKHLDLEEEILFIFWRLLSPTSVSLEYLTVTFWTLAIHQNLHLHYKSQGLALIRVCA